MISSHIDYTEKPDVSQFNMHTHDYYEIYCFLSGNTKFFVEGHIYPLKSGDILVMKRAEAHSLLFNSQVPYERIVVHFTAESIVEDVRNDIVNFLENRPLGQKNRYSSSQFKETNWMYYLNRMCQTDDQRQKSVYLTVLLSELKDRFAEIKAQEVSDGGVMEIVNYINANLTGNLNLDILCNRFFISKSHINRKFKILIGTTVWEYITTKRLLLAKELIRGGTPPTEVFLRCGFKDYCTFFRSYKTKFGVSPKSDSKKN